MLHPLATTQNEGYLILFCDRLWARRALANGGRDYGTAGGPGSHCPPAAECRYPLGAPQSPTLAATP
eukprot:3517074-Prymnesium_polylepis.2